MSKNALIIAGVIVILGVAGGAFWYSANKKPTVNIEVNRGGSTRGGTSGTQLPGGDRTESPSSGATTGSTETSITRQQAIDLIKKNIQSASEINSMNSSASQINENTDL